MIPIFRRKRKQLADENKALKYMRYAFGEIVLVVIGILIALSINNWNNTRKNRDREVFFVNQLAADLQTSIVDLKEIMEFFSDNAIASGKVVHAFYKPSLQKDFNPMVFLKPLRNGRYIPVMGTARALVSSGDIDLLRSVKLRNAIIVYIEKTEALLMDVDRFEAFYFRMGMESIDGEADIINLIAKYRRENNYKYPKVLTDLQRATIPVPYDFEVIPFPVSVEDLFKNEIILRAYSNLLLAHQNTYYQYKIMLKATEELFRLIQSEGYSVKVEDLSENKVLVFDSTDLLIIQKADSILSDQSNWNKDDDRYCFDDIHKGRYSLYCALYKASVDITGEYEHRRPVMQQVRFIIDKYGQDRVINHRLMDWNNHSETSFGEVKQVLKEATDSIEIQLYNR
jgi:hypothetical protein